MRYRTFLFLVFVTLSLFLKTQGPVLAKELQFGDVQVGHTEILEMTYHVGIGGDISARCPNGEVIDSYSIDGPNKAEFIVLETNISGHIALGEELRSLVLFVPLTPGPKSATFTVKAHGVDANCAPTWTPCNFIGNGLPHGNSSPSPPDMPCPPQPPNSTQSPTSPSDPNVSRSNYQIANSFDESQWNQTGELTEAGKTVTVQGGDQIAIETSSSAGPLPTNLFYFQVLAQPIDSNGNIQPTMVTPQFQWNPEYSSGPTGSLGTPNQMVLQGNPPGTQFRWTILLPGQSETQDNNDYTTIKVFTPKPK